MPPMTVAASATAPARGRGSGRPTSCGSSSAARPNRRPAPRPTPSGRSRRTSTTPAARPSGRPPRAILAAGALDAWLGARDDEEGPAGGRPGVPGRGRRGGGRRGDDLPADADVRPPPVAGPSGRNWIASTSQVETPFGPVRIKVGRRGGQIVAASPEYDDCLRQAEARGAAFREVYEAARLAWAAQEAVAGARVAWSPFASG